MTKIEEIKATAKKLLEEGKVKYIIGYEQGTNGWLVEPGLHQETRRRRKVRLGSDLRP